MWFDSDSTVCVNRVLSVPMHLSSNNGVLWKGECTATFIVEFIKSICFTSNFYLRLPKNLCSNYVFCMVIMSCKIKKWNLFSCNGYDNTWWASWGYAWLEIASHNHIIGVFAYTVWELSWYRQELSALKIAIFINTKIEFPADES